MALKLAEVLADMMKKYANNQLYLMYKTTSCSLENINTFLYGGENIRFAWWFVYPNFASGKNK